MKRYLDDFFLQQMNQNACVIAADMGYFPKSRTHGHFIDVGNNESAVGGIANELISDGDVYIYDVCGYIMRNSYSTFINAFTSDSKGKLMIFGWGSGFAYDGCLQGHYPFDDINLAAMFGLEVWELERKSELENLLALAPLKAMNMYVRLLDLHVYSNDVLYKRKRSTKLNIAARGWLKHEVCNYLYTLPENIRKMICVSYYFNNDDIKTIYVTDQYQIEKDILKYPVCCPSQKCLYASKVDFLNDIIYTQLDSYVKETLL